MKVYDRPRMKMKEEVKSTAVAPTRNEASEAVGNSNPNLSWPANAMFMPPWFFPPYASAGAFPASPAAVPLPPTPTASSKSTPPCDPLLSEWLKQCDEGPRGADGHLFTSYLPAFQANWMTRLSDIARLSSAKDLLDCVADYQPKMPFGTASRLLDYAKTDYKPAS